MQDFDILGLEDLFLFYILLRILKQGINSFIGFTLAIIDLKVVSKEFLGLTDLSRAQTLNIYKSLKVFIVEKHENFMLKAF